MELNQLRAIKISIEKHIDSGLLFNRNFNRPKLLRTGRYFVIGH